MEKSTIITRISQWLSIVLNPLMLPTLAVAILVFGNSIMSTIPSGVKWFFLGVVALNTMIIPVLSIGLLHTFQIIPDVWLSDRKHRFLPMLIIGICYFLCLLMLSDVVIAFLVKRFIYAALASLVMAAIVTYFWKISLHMTAIGGVVAMLLLLNITGFGESYYSMLILIMLSGFLASARLQLGCHTWAQVTAGFFGGFTVSLLMLLFA